MKRSRGGRASWPVVILFILLILITAYLHSANRLPSWPSNTGSANPGATPAFGLPVATQPLEILGKSHFTIGYDDDALQPAWVVYPLSGPIVEHGHEKRPAKFATDTAVAHPSQHDDYDRSGFDRGHLCPAYAEWSRYGEDGMVATFITSNICPQIHGLNAGLWEDLESCIAGREGAGDGWAGDFGTVWVIDGPVIAPGAERLPAGEKIPNAFFMIVLRQTSGTWDDLAVEMPNRDITGSMSDYLVSVRQIEHDTGLTFFNALDATTRARLEDAKATALWPHQDFDSRHHHRN